MTDSDRLGDAYTVPPNVNRPSIRPTTEPLSPNNLASGGTGGTVTNNIERIRGVYKKESVRASACECVRDLGVIEVLPSHPELFEPKSLCHKDSIVGHFIRPPTVPTVQPSLTVHLCNVHVPTGISNKSNEHSIKSNEHLNSLNSPPFEPIKCSTCDCPLYWESGYGSFRCYECDPPPAKSLIRRKWMVVIDESAREHGSLAWEAVIPRNVSGNSGRQDAEDTLVADAGGQRGSGASAADGVAEMTAEVSFWASSFRGPAPGQSIDEWWDSTADQTEFIFKRLIEKRELKMKLIQQQRELETL